MDRRCSPSLSNPCHAGNSYMHERARTESSRGSWATNYSYHHTASYPHLVAHDNDDVITRITILH